MDERGPLDAATWQRIRTSASVGWIKFRKGRSRRFIHLVVTGAANMRLMVVESSQPQLSANEGLTVHFDGNDVAQALDAVTSTTQHMVRSGYRRKEWNGGMYQGQWLTQRIAEIAKDRLNLSASGLNVD